MTAEISRRTRRDVGGRVALSANADLLASVIYREQDSDAAPVLPRTRAVHRGFRAERLSGRSRSFSRALVMATWCWVGATTTSRKKRTPSSFIPPDDHRAAADRTYLQAQAEQRLCLCECRVSAHRNMDARDRVRRPRRRAERFDSTTVEPQAGLAAASLGLDHAALRRLRNRQARAGGESDHRTDSGRRLQPVLRRLQRRQDEAPRLRSRSHAAACGCSWARAHEARARVPGAGRLRSADRRPQRAPASGLCGVDAQRPLGFRRRVSIRGVRAQSGDVDLRPYLRAAPAACRCGCATFTRAASSGTHLQAM